MESRPLTPAGERVLTAASGLFYTRGIHAVGVDEIADVAGTTKKTLYAQFRSKERLVDAYLRRRMERWRVFCSERITEDPLTVFDALAEWHVDDERGCAFVNAWAEIGGTDHVACAVVREDKQWMRDLFVRLAGEPVGPQLHLLYEGALVVATAGGRPDAIGEARAAAAGLTAG